MNILIIGLGSIGQRHLRNIKQAYPTVNFFALKRVKKSPALNSQNKIINRDLIAYYKIKIIDNLKVVLTKKIKIDMVFICGPSSHHCDQIILFAKMGIYTFVEKPICINKKQLKKLKFFFKKPNIKRNVMVGFQNKFNPIIKFLKNEIKKRYKDIIRVNFFNGESIVKFHEYENYKVSYAAKKKLGGGAILTQKIHELDKMQFLFEGAKFNKLVSYSNKISNLKVDTEDLSISLYNIRKKNFQFLSKIDVNIFQQPKKNYIEIIFKNETLKADLTSNVVYIYNNKATKKKKFNFKRNDVFVSEIKYAINCAKKGQIFQKRYSIQNSFLSHTLAIDLIDRYHYEKKKN